MITIIVLLILAVVAIGAVRDSGIIGHAQNSADKYNTGKAEEESMLGQYEDAISQYENGDSSGEDDNFGTSGDGSGGNIPVGDVTILEAQADSMLSKTTNSTTYDSYGNKIVVPAGFKILVDDTTGYTADNLDVTKGIVIKDSKENEFVWIPVGENITNGTKTETIKLSRYTFDSTTGKETDIGDAPIGICQELATSNKGNATAKNLSGFLSSVNTNNGYYIARYEAGVTGYDSSKTTYNSNEETNWTGYVAEEGKELKLVSKDYQRVWDIVTQNKASELCQNMYEENSNYTSDLVNSYAWDTAIVFIQTFGTEGYSSKYSILNACSSDFDKTGCHSDDKVCNIYEMSGNASEWSTETSNDDSDPCVMRGGHNTKSSERYGYTGMRVLESDETASDFHSFRPLLYLED